MVKHTHIRRGVNEGKLQKQHFTNHFCVSPSFPKNAALIQPAKDFDLNSLVREFGYNAKTRIYRLICFIDFGFTGRAGSVISAQHLGMIFSCTCIEVFEQNLTRRMHIPISAKGGETTDEPTNVSEIV